MRFAALLIAACMAFATPAAAQSSLSLAADPVPIVEARINGQPVRLEVDLRMPDVLVLNPASAERLGVRPVPFVRAGVGLDDALIRGRIARPRVVFEGAGDARVTTGIFNVPASSRADGLIGPGALPYETIRIELGAVSASESEIAFELNDADIWEALVNIGGESVETSFDLGNRVSTFNRTAAARFNDAGLIRPNGEHAETAMLLGLRAPTQPVLTDLAVEGITLGSAVARTQFPLIGAGDEETIVISAQGNVPPPSLWVGRDALERCSSISVERRTRRMIVRCAS